MKDRFSDRSADYATFRPVYPPELINFILSNLSSRETCWDVGTGNGQLLSLLAPHFHKAIGTDSSSRQLSFAPKADNVEFIVCSAEEDPQFSNDFSLITVAQAIHWFKFDAFYSQVEKYLAEDGLFVVTGYGLMSISPEIDVFIEEMYAGILGAWWDPERKYIDEMYRTIPFPFEEMTCPHFTIQTQWNLSHFEGYIRTWSAYRLYLNAGHPDPVPGWIEKVKAVWPAEEVKEVRFPVPLRAGRKKR